MLNVTMGCDPELMLIRNDGTLASALPILKGRKERAEPLPCGATVMADNVLAEFTIPPAKSSQEFVDNIRSALQGLKSMVPGLKLFAIPSANFPQSELKSDEAKKFGCDPDFDAWTCDVNEINTERAAKRAFRSAGGHIHIGHSHIADNWDNKPLFITVCDAIIGLAATIIDSHDDSRERRKLYGKAGAHRPKDYGVEYRTPSNFWITKPELTNLIYELSHRSLETFVSSGTTIVDKMGSKNIVKAINTSDQKVATDLLEKVGIEYLGKDLMRKIFSTQVSKEDRDVAVSWKLL